MYFVVQREDFVGETSLFRPGDGKVFRRWFSFLTSRCGKVVILLFWLALFVNGVFWAPRLVYHTRMSSSSPSGTKGATARNKFQQNFHRVQTTQWMSVLFHCITYECQNQTIDITDSSLRLQNITDEVKRNIQHYNSTKWSHFRDFFDYYGESAKCRRYASSATEAQGCIDQQRSVYIGGVGSRNDTALMAVGFKNSMTPERRQDLVDWLDDMLKTVYHHYGEQIKLSFTSQFALLDDVQHHSANSIIAHALSLPLIVIIFCIGTSSWRPAFVPLLNSVVSIMVSFSIVFPFALYVAKINTMTPDLMAVVCVALTIDYDLFFFNIFYEELGLDFNQGIIHIRTLHSVLRKTLRRSSKVIGMSSSILCLSVFMYLLCDYGFLITYGCGLIVAILCAVLINVSLTPALVLCIPGFFVEKSLNCDCTRVVDDDSAPALSGRPRIIDGGGFYSDYETENLASQYRSTAHKRPSYLGSAPGDNDIEVMGDSTPLIASSMIESAADNNTNNQGTTQTIGGSTPAGSSDSPDQKMNDGIYAEAGAVQSTDKATPQEPRHKKRGSRDGSKGSSFISFGGYNSEESGSSEDFTGLAMPKQSLVPESSPSHSGRTVSGSGSLLNTQTSAVLFAAEHSAHTAEELSQMDLETRARLRGRRLEYHPFGRGEEDSTLGIVNKGCYKVGVVSTLFPCTILFILSIGSVLLWLTLVFAVEYKVDYDQNLVLPFDGKHVKTFQSLADYYWEGKSTSWRVLIPISKNGHGEATTNTVYNYTYIRDTSTIWRNIWNDVNSNTSNHYLGIRNINGLSVVSNNFISSRQEWNGYMNSDLYHAFYDVFGDSDQSNDSYVDSKVSYFLIDSQTDPFGKHSADFLKKLRSMLSKYCGRRYTPSNYDYKCYVYGDSVGAIDTVDRIYEYFPYMIAAGMILCFVVSGFVFNNKWLPVRYAITVALPLLAAYGFAVGVYQDGWLDGLHSRAVSKKDGISWIIPLMTASLMFGLALDYDMYLSERIREHTRKGDEVRTAVVKSVYESGSVISSAALIMAAAMSPLLFWNKTTGLNQAALIVIVSVLFDTFIVRPIFAPALITLTDSSAESWIIDPCFRMFCLDEDRDERWRVLLRFDWHTNEPRVEMIQSGADNQASINGVAPDDRPLMGSRL